MVERLDNERSKQHCCKLLTFGEKTLLFLLIVSVIIFLSLFVLIVYLMINGRNICETPICVKASAKLLDRLDVAVDPCQNFAEFVCGRDSPQEYIDDEAKLAKIQIVSAAWNDEDSRSILAMKRFYQACINTSAIEKNGDGALLNILDSVGGWPLLLGENWQGDETFNWLEFMTKLREFGLKNDWFISLNYYQDENGTNLLMIGPPSNIKQIRNNVKLVYYETMASVAVKLGSSFEFAWQELRKVSNFEHELSLIVDRAQNKSLFDQQGNFLKINVEELNIFWPKLDLVEIFNALSKGYARFSKNTEVVLAVTSFIYDLNTLLQKTAVRTQANFMIWKIIEGYLPYSRDELREKYEQYTVIDNRETYCFSELTTRFHDALEAQYLHSYVNTDMTQSLKVMTNLIKDGIIDGEFASPASELIITGAEAENSDNILEMEFSSSNILRMVNEVHLRVENSFFACLYQNTSWCHHNGYHLQNAESTEQGYFDVIQNAIILPSKFLQSEWYEVGQPNYMNYGRIGRVIGNAFKDTLTRLDINENGTKSGLDLAFQGYLRWVQLHGIEKNLPGVNYTNKQIFWINSARQFCDFGNNNSTNELFNEINNSEYFAREFQC